MINVHTIGSLTRPGYAALPRQGIVERRGIAERADPLTPVRCAVYLGAVSDDLKVVCRRDLPDLAHRRGVSVQVHGKDRPEAVLATGGQRLFDARDIDRVRRRIDIDE